MYMYQSYVAVFGNSISTKPCHCVQKYFSASYFLMPMFNGSVACIYNIEGIRWKSWLHKLFLQGAVFR